MFLKQYAFLCDFDSDVLLTMNNLRKISIFCQNT